MRRALVAFLLTLFIVAPAQALQAESADECVLFTAIAVSARALSALGVDAKTITAYVAEVYPIVTPTQAQIAKRIIEVARTETRSADDFARALFGACMDHQGNLDPILGVRL